MHNTTLASISTRVLATLVVSVVHTYIHACMYGYVLRARLTLHHACMSLVLTNQTPETHRLEP